MPPQELLIWTLCQFDVPPNEAYLAETAEEARVTCPLCLSGESAGQPLRERVGIIPVSG